MSLSAHTPGLVGNIHQPHATFMDLIWGLAASGNQEAEASLSVNFYFIFIRVWLIYSVVSISAVQHGDPVLYIYIYILFLVFLRPHLWHMEVPRLGVESALQLLACAIVTAMPHLSCLCDLHHKEMLGP